MRSFPVNIKDEETGTYRVIPVSFSTGNHDLGLTSYTPVEVKHTPHEPLYQHFYPQKTKDGEVPKLEDRKVYFSQSIGDDIIIFNLDTAYGAPMKGAQTEWLKEELSKTNAKIKFAQFHGPIYTVCKQEKWNDDQVQRDGKEYWVPLFDQYNMTIVFENHCHMFKR